MDNQNCEQAVIGSLLGTAIGDALGLPYEGLAPDRAARMLGQPTRHRFAFGRGMVSDDTEHTCMVLQSLIDANNDDSTFAPHFARRIKWWFLMIPAGIGMATARACIRLLFGISPEKSGVFSAGNGPAMRSAILGAAIDDIEQLRRLVRTSTRITHTDPKAEQGAFAIALAARTAKTPQTRSAKNYFSGLRELLAQDKAEEFIAILNDVEKSLETGESTITFCSRQFGSKGVSGYTFQTVPAVLHAWLSDPDDYRTAITNIIRCGGDTDTTAAILGGIIGAGVGRKGLPEDLLAHLAEWPRTVTWMENLACCYTQSQSSTTPIRTPRLSLFAVLVRNIIFLGIVLFHGFRRLAPPY